MAAFREAPIGEISQSKLKSFVDTLEIRLVIVSATIEEVPQLYAPRLPQM